MIINPYNQYIIECRSCCWIWLTRPTASRTLLRSDSKLLFMYALSNPFYVHRCTKSIEVECSISCQVSWLSQCSRTYSHYSFIMHLGVSLCSHIISFIFAYRSFIVFISYVREENSKRKKLVGCERDNSTHFISRLRNDLCNFQLCGT